MRVFENIPDRVLETLKKDQLYFIMLIKLINEPAIIVLTPIRLSAENLLAVLSRLDGDAIEMKLKALF